MGCDIHGSIEKFVDGKWVHVQRVEREDCPHDISDEAKLHSDEWGEDGHSHSHLLVEEAASRADGVKDYIERSVNPVGRTQKWFGYGVPHLYDPEELHLYRFVFWFDN